jgi:hypothetical protein
MSNFRWINKQGVESDLGFIVQFTGRFTAEYREAGRIFVVDVEDGGLSGDKSNILYSRSSLLRFIPSQSEQQRVETNFRDAMLFQGLVPVAYA